MTAGIHHVTAIARDPQRNLSFYAGVLGLRLVKRTVNFEDPGSYHLYYGDAAGRPGTIVTFFPWPDGRPGRHGRGQAVVTSLAVPPGATGYWIERFIRSGVTYESPTQRFGASVLPFRDPDGLRLQLVAAADAAERPHWTGAGVPADAAVRGVHSVGLWADDPARTARFAAEHLGLRELDRDADTIRLAAGDGGSGTLVDLRAAPGMWSGLMGVGAVHHVAFRAADDGAQEAVRASLRAAGAHPTDRLDRKYFRSIYFREPGGVLFELATDDPGFTVDEAEPDLGSALQLPAWYEERRADIAAALPPLYPPGPVP